jgi:hypothetical protein
MRLRNYWEDSFVLAVTFLRFAVGERPALCFADGADVP